jgi:cytochrome c-type biogenesis protein CcmH
MYASGGGGGMGSVRAWRVFFLLLTVSLALFFLLSNGPNTIHAQEQYCVDQRSTELNKQLLCPQCSGQTIHQSQAPIAQDMRSRVCSLIDEGVQDEEILDYFVARYGENVLAEPPKSGFSLTIWLIPFVAMALGIGGLIWAVKALRGPAGQPLRMQHAASTPPPGLERYMEMVDSEMEGQEAKDHTTDD